MEITITLDTGDVWETIDCAYPVFAAEFHTPRQVDPYRAAVINSVVSALEHAADHEREEALLQAEQEDDDEV